MPFFYILCSKDCSNKSFPHIHYFMHTVYYSWYMYQKQREIFNAF